MQWHDKIDYALWANRINIKIAIKISPYELVYGKRYELPIRLELPVLKLLQEFEDLDCEPLQIKLN